MIKVGIIGASGYTGVELARILANHPGVEITVVTSRRHQGLPLSALYPNLKGIVDLACVDAEAGAVAGAADLFFTAVPHQTAMAIVPTLLDAGRKVIDLSADFRIHDSSVYEQWYQPHTAPELLGEAVYGLPELHRTEIRKARLIANPGCYPTSIILGLAPLLKARAIDPDTVIADSKSGTSGAGRTVQQSTLFCEVADGFKAYKVASHRHTPEIEQELGKLCGRPVAISFTPHLVPMSRGIFSTIYASLKSSLSSEEATDLFLEYYRDEPFVRICDPGTLPATPHVRGGNFCDLACKVDHRTGRIIVLAAIDNLVKGAAGQAVQNMNLLLGLPENQGLGIVPLFP